MSTISLHPSFSCSSPGNDSVQYASSSLSHRSTSVQLINLTALNWTDQQLCNLLAYYTVEPCTVFARELARPPGGGTYKEEINTETITMSEAH